MIRKSSTGVVLVICIIGIFCCGCDKTPIESTDFTHAVIEEDIEKEPNNVYHWAHPSVFEDIPPIITETTDNDSFLTEYYWPETWSDAVDCFSYHAIVDDENLVYGTYYRSSDGDVDKVCAIADCRSNSDHICDHLTSQLNAHSAVWYEDCLYYFGTTLARPSGKTIKWFVLRWEKEADLYEKIFESDRLLTEINFHKGIMYVKAPRNFIGDSSLYYAVNINEEIYTEIEVGTEVYKFSKDAIVRIDNTGAYFTNSLMKPLEHCYDDKYLGQVYGEFYYYIKDSILYRTEQGSRGKSQKLISNVAAFTVCDGIIYYMPDTGNEAETLFYYKEYEFNDGVITITDDKAPYIGFKNRKIWCAEIDSTGRIKNERIVYQPQNNEWIIMYQADYYHGQAIQIITVTAGDGEYIQYYKNHYLIDMNGALNLGSEVSKIDADRIK